jgi:hypothetical protein
MLELSMWKKSTLARLEHHQGQKRNIGHMFRNASPDTAKKYLHLRAKDIDYDIPGGVFVCVRACVRDCGCGSDGSDVC